MKKIWIATLILALIGGCKKESETGVSPEVKLTNPINDAIGISLNSKVSAIFSLEMDSKSITNTSFTLKQGNNNVTGEVSYSNLTTVFTPTVNLTASTVYTATITNEVKSTSGKTMDKNYVWNFTTGTVIDETLPTITFNSPLNNAIGVELNKQLSVNFSESMDPFSINTTSITLKLGIINIAGQVLYSGTTAKFLPTNQLIAETAYKLTITKAVKDLAGNAIASETEINFTTGTTLIKLAAVELGLASNYVILAKTAINNISTSAITGNLGLSPAATSYITGLSITDATGYATSAQVTGKLYAADMADPTPINLTTAVNNMVTAYNDAAGRVIPDYIELGTGNIGSKTLAPGLYKWTNTVTIPTNITIAGGATDVWIFQIAGDLIMSSAVKITLTGGAQAKNIFWQVAGQATIGTTAQFKGVILSMTGINFQTGATLNGKALAQTAVVLDGNTIVGE